MELIARQTDRQTLAIPRGALGPKNSHRKSHRHIFGSCAPFITFASGHSLYKSGLHLEFPESCLVITLTESLGDLAVKDMSKSLYFVSVLISVVSSPVSIVLLT